MVVDEDEIDLVDLFLILWNRRKLILSIFVLFVISGLVFCFGKVDKYSYVTTFEIGTLLSGSKDAIKRLNVESPDTVKVKLDQVYIPRAIKKQQDQNGEMYRASSMVQKNSNIITITSVGPDTSEKKIIQLHREIFQPLIDNHKLLVATGKNEYEIRAVRAKLKLKELTDPNIYSVDEKIMEGDIGRAEAQVVKLNDEQSLLVANKKRLTETQVILKEQIARIEKNLDQVYRNRTKAATEVDDETKALTFLMVNSQIEQNEKLLISLKERAYVKIENQKQLLGNQLAQNSRDMGLQKDKIAELKSSLVKLRAQRENDINNQKSVIEEIKRKVDFYRDSELLGLAQKSLEKEGPGILIILSLSIVLGGIAGVFLAFVVEFLGKVSQKSSEQNV